MRSIFMLMLLCPLAHAEVVSSDPVGWEFAPLYGYRSSVGFDAVDEEVTADVDIDAAPTYGALLEFPSGRNTQWQIFVSRQSTELDGGSLVANIDLDVDYVHFAGTYVMEGDRVRPYVGFGFGATRLDPEAPYDGETEFSIAFLTGLKFRLAEHLGLRLDLRALGTLTDADAAVFCSGGCVARYESDAFWQYEATVGLNLYF